MPTFVAPPGWPAQVRPPDAPDWERTAQNWLLDICPPEYRAYPALRRHVVVLARFAVLHVEEVRHHPPLPRGQLRPPRLALGVVGERHHEKVGELLGRVAEAHTRGAQRLAPAFDDRRADAAELLPVGIGAAIMNVIEQADQRTLGECVDDDVAQSGDRSPRNIWHGIPGAGRQGSNSLADDPEVAQHRVVRHRPELLRPEVLLVLLAPIDRGEDICEPIGV